MFNPLSKTKNVEPIESTLTTLLNVNVLLNSTNLSLIEVVRFVKSWSASNTLLSEIL